MVALKKIEKWQLMWPFFFILMLHCVAILFFTRGFLLTRTELSTFSECSDISQSPCFDQTLNETVRDNGSCWTKPAVGRVVIIVLDALRFDFVAPSTYFEEKKPWMDKLQVLQKLASQEGLSARIFKAIADPPTTSLQRLKGLTTGGLPTFIDVGNSFGAPAIVEDNLLHQLVQNGKRVWMMGDDTWVQLFPDHFDKSFPFPSFNVKDLDTVDDGCVQHLLPSLYEEEWDVLIAHFLGMDHAGHIFGVDTLPMIKKLEQYNAIIEDGNKTRVSSFQQLDFAVTMAALLGVPFPFGSIGRVNPELYALSSGTWIHPQTGVAGCKNQSNLEEWMQNYAHVLCTNSWQVKRYIDLYSESSVIGFPSEDMVHVQNMYAQAHNNWSVVQKSLLSENENTNRSCSSSLADLEGLIDAYSKFLASVTELARSKWTEFDLRMMGIGLGILLLSLVIHLVAVNWANNLQQVSYPSVVDSQFSLSFISAIFVVAIRGLSFLANSYILTEGKVANYLLVTTAIINLRYSIRKKRMLVEALGFLLLNLILRITTEPELSKQIVDFVKNPEILPILSLTSLAILVCKFSSGNNCWRFSKYFFIVAILFSYLLIPVHWILENNMQAMAPLLEGTGRSFIPRIIYMISFGLFLLLIAAQFFNKEMSAHFTECILINTVAMLLAWSSTVIVIMGKQGPLFVLAFVVGGWCIVRLGNLEMNTKDEIGVLTTNPIPVIQWSFFAVCMFFYTGHWCAFDGLRYGAAFTGFDEFNLVRQAIILSIDTFGLSHILPILGIPFLVIFKYPRSLTFREKGDLLANLSQVLLMYGLITSTTTMFTMICVTIQRRHLMVWGLFAPKFVFDVVGLILTDVLICFSSFYYFSRVESAQVSE